MDDARRKKYLSLARELRALGARPEARAIERAALQGDVDAWRKSFDGASVWSYVEGLLDALLIFGQYLPREVRASGLRALEALTDLERPSAQIFVLRPANDTADSGPRAA